VLSPGPTRTPGLTGPALFLASAESSFITGIELFAGGGQAQI
jgi:hypothetical protein